MDITDIQKDQAEPDHGTRRGQAVLLRTPGYTRPEYPGCILALAEEVQSSRSGPINIRIKGLNKIFLWV